VVTLEDARSRPTRKAPPHNIAAEQALLGACLLTPAAIERSLGLVAAGDFYRPAHIHIFDAIVALHSKGAGVDQVTVAAELETVGLLDVVGGLPALTEIVIGTPSTDAGRYAAVIAEHALSRRMIAVGAEIVELGYSSRDDIGAAFASAQQLLSGVVGTATPTISTLAEFLNMEIDDGEEVIPGLLEAGDRLIVTAGEGTGKSTLVLRQFPMAAAGGVHPFTGEEIEPVWALVVDLENGRRLVRRKMGELRQLLPDRSPADDHLMIELPDEVDLLDGRSAAQFEATVAAAFGSHESDRLLLAVGPLYKMASGDPTLEETARAVSAVIDRIRARHGCPVLIEAHSPHNEIRPYGASLWKRWPEFGIHLGADGQVTHWRGQRDQRDWPTALRRGGYWPWTPVAVDRDPEPWSGPTRCQDAILELFGEEPGVELNVNRMHEVLQAAAALPPAPGAQRATAYRKSTVSAAAEGLVNKGRLSFREGPRKSHLYRLRETSCT
jgi:DnaB-like helicase N terminal domain/AAA domain